MDESRINRKVELSLRSAMDLMFANKAVTDGEYIFGISEVRMLDGWILNVVCQYQEWNEKPVGFMCLSDWEQKYAIQIFCPYTIPMNEEEALAAMKEGEIVRDTDNGGFSPYPLFFFNTVKNPLNGFEGYVFCIKEENTTPTIVGTEAEFLDHTFYPHYVVYKEKEE